jgi:hypothetical protein
MPSHKLALDSRVDRMVAKGDNCEGIENKEKEDG